MATQETNIVHTILKDVSPSGVRLWKNVRGFFCTIDSVTALINAARTLNGLSIRTAITNLRKVMAGLQAEGASDLIGFKPLLITQEMVGLTIAQFAVIEVKTATGRPSPEQLNFIAFVEKNGGLSGVARSAQDAKRILKIPVDGSA